MSSKKNFKNNPALPFISAAAVHEEQKEQNTLNTQEAHDIHNTPNVSDEPISKRTQGKKGQKLPRINMAFSPENMAHIQLMGRVMGCSATEYVNRLIAADREARGDVVEQALKLFKEAKSK